MINTEKYAYFFKSENKTESFGIIKPAHNWGEPKNEAELAVRKIFPKKADEFCILEVLEGGQAPFGSFLSDMLSINFSEAEEFFNYNSRGWKGELTQKDLILLPEDIRILAPKEEVFVGRNILTDVKRLYIVRKFIEMCIEHPRLYTFGQFQQLLDTIYENGWQLKPLGFFAAIDLNESKQYFFRDAFFHKASYFDIRDDLSRLEGHLEYVLLSRGEEYFLQEPVIEVFEVSNAVDAVLLSLFHLIQERVAVKKCANCGKFFVPLARSDAIYCDRLAPQDNTKTCKEYGSKVLWYEHVINDDVAKLARNVYSAKQMLAKRNSDKPEYMEMFEYFKQEKKKWEEQVKAGTKTREEYANWLKKMKLCKTKAELEET